ncbi:cation transporter [Paramaledivibacter caminithermalis]|jgi:Cu+-exporting ATPase|uniref:Copper chaperone CopZ n=1 Tax=Paramaledivibacter caminithermalis (strain DSM 15212 / CIP 107654 / DViRD3) TaxID=1121301 RepID=A0A1M6R284_PARC5|nr:heavy metal-associated domain-containing protein [Paramaledivibacter caminithermalis]SHK26533.1 copper ion binding protein [Paramaledivibacter caminithermalis DSM 15212]
MIIEKVFRIEGMTCAACVRAVERGIRKIDGIDEVSVNLATEKMIVKYDEDKLSQGKIIDTIVKLGYKAVLKDELKEVIIPIQGMT